MSTFLDFAIGLSLVNGISGQIHTIIGDFRALDGVTDEMMGQLSKFKDISIKGGLLAGAGIAGLKMTADALGDCVSEAEKLQSVSTALEIKAFGDDLLNESKLPEIKRQMEELENTAMNVSLDTVFNAQQIQESMISMVKGGMSKEMVGSQGAEANAYFAQINGVDAISTVDATVKFVAGFQLGEDEIKDSFDLITKYSDASIADALAIQQNIGNASGTAMSVWKGRKNIDIAEETIQLVAATKYTSGDEAMSATMVRNFLDAAGKTTFTKPQTEVMQQAGWLNDGKSIFVDYDTGMLKNAAELEKIIEDTSNTLNSVDFNNLLDVVFGDRGKKTAQALAQQGGATDLATLKTGAGKQLGIDEQVAKQMETAVAQAGIFEESMNSLKATLGKPFLEGKIAMFKQFNNLLSQAIIYFKENPEVIKFMVAIAAGTSGFLLLIGSIMLLVGLIGSLKLVLSIVGPKIVTAFLPVLGTLAIVIAVVMVIAGLAYVIYKNWDTLKPQFQSIMGHLSQLLGMGKRAFLAFAEKALPVLSSIWSAFETGALFIISVVCPIIDSGLRWIINLLNGDFKGTWESINPVVRTALLLLAPSILVVAGCLIMMASAMLVSKATALGLSIAMGVATAATKVASVTTTVWKGIVTAATFVQTAWTLAMNGGTGAMLAQKLAIAALMPLVLLVRGAIAVWTGAQWLLNAAMAANPIAIVILLIVGIIAVVGVATGYFKKFVEWVQKGWEKLKNFLGFKKDVKSELEEPINMNINENVNGTNISSVSGGAVADANGIFNQVQGIVNQKVRIPIGAEIDNNTLSIVSGGVQQCQNVINGGIKIPVETKMDNNLQAIINGDVQNYLSALGGGYDIPIEMDMTQFQGQSDEMLKNMYTMGADGTSQLASGISGETSLQALGVSMDSVNGTITNGLIKDDEMRLYGSNLMQSFINGIEGKMEALRAAVSIASNVVGDYLGVHSPTKKGALHTNQLWGGNLIQSFISGMYGKNSQLEGAVSLISSTVGGINKIWQYDIGYKGIMPNIVRNSKSNDETNKSGRPIYIIIQGGDKKEKEIGVEVAKELEKRGFGEREVEIDSSLTMSPYGYRLGY